MRGIRGRGPATGRAARGCLGSGSSRSSGRPAAAPRRARRRRRTAPSASRSMRKARLRPERLRGGDHVRRHRRAARGGVGGGPVGEAHNEATRVAGRDGTACGRTMFGNCGWREIEESVIVLLFGGTPGLRRGRDYEPLESCPLCCGRTLHRALRYRLRGSSASRSPSPSRLNASTVTKIASPGNTAIQGACVRNRCAMFSIDPQLGAGGC